MTQAPLYLFMFVLGLLFQVGTCRQRNIWFASCFAFPTGLAFTVVAALLQMVAKLRLSLLGIALLLAPVVVVSIVRAARPTRRQLIEAAAAIVLFAIATIILCSIDASTFSRDSETIIERAFALSRGNGEGVDYFRAKGTLTPVAYTFVCFTGEDYLYALASISSFSLMLLFGAAGWVFAGKLPSAGRRLAVRLFCLAAAATMTTYMVLFHSFYVHTNLHAALYLFAFVISVYAAVERRDRSILIMVPLFLTAYALTRVEGYLFALIVVVLATPYLASLSPRDATVTVGAWLGAMILWFVYMLPLPQADKLTDDRVHYVFALIVVGSLALMAHSRVRVLQWAVDRARWILPLTLIGLIALAFVVRSLQMGISLDVTIQNLFHEKRMWGYFWDLMIILFPVLLVTRPHRTTERLFGDVGLSIALSMLAIGAIHVYRFGIGDSGNRMLVQVLPLVMVSLAMAAWRLLDASPGRDRPAP